MVGSCRTGLFYEDTLREVLYGSLGGDRTDQAGYLISGCILEGREEGVFRACADSLARFLTGAWLRIGHPLAGGRHALGEFQET